MADLSTLETIKASDKPIEDDFSYIYAESVNKAFIRIAKEELKKLILDGEYTNEEIDQKISTIPKFTTKVVSNLPTTDISETTVYLVSSGNDSENLYTEYININGLWEILGTQKSTFSGSASDVTYDDTETKLGATNVQDAVGKLSATIGDLKENSASSWNDLTDKPFDERFEEVTIDLNEYITEWEVADQENSLIAAEVQFETDFGLYAGSKVKFVFDDKELEYTLEDISTVIGSDMIGCGDISSIMTGDLSTVNLIFTYGFIDGVGMMQIMLKGSIPTVANLISEVVVVDKLDAKFYDKSLPKVTENDNENIAMVVDGKWVAAPIDRKWRVLLDKTTTVGIQNPFFVNIDDLLGKNKINEFLFQVELPDDVNNATKIKVGEVNSGLEFNMPNVNRRLSIYMSIAEGEYFNIISTYSGNLTGEGGVMFPIRISKINNTNYNYFQTATFELYKYTDRVNIPKGARCRILGR